jgi:hypothetical protein
MRRALLMLPLLATLGCPAADDDSGGVEEPTEYIYDDVDEPAPELGPTELAAAIEDALETVVTLDAEPFGPLYDSLMAQADASCPYSLQLNDGTNDFDYWEDSCEAGSGAYFDGTTFHYEFVDVMSDGYLVNGFYTGLSGSVSNALGQTLEGSGVIASYRGEQEGFSYWQQVLNGAYTWDGPEAAGTFLATTLRPTMTRTAFLTPSADAHMVQLEGGVAGLGGALDTLSVSNFVLMDAAAGSTCPSEPAGTVSVRDASGNWYDVVFDGPGDADVNVPAADCDGCGATFYRGDSVGQTCVDFSVLLGWDTQPW